MYSIYGRSPHGGRGLKRLQLDDVSLTFIGRSPHGGRGLKLFVFIYFCAFGTSLPARGAWIETMIGIHTQHAVMSLPARGAWIETNAFRITSHLYFGSLPARGAWIETIIMF